MEHSESYLVRHENGTVTDPGTGIVWMIPFLGEGWSGRERVGSGVGLSWHEATDFYGKGRQMGVREASSPRQPYWRVNSNKKPILSRDSYQGYRVGTKRYEFAGHSDWRMPVVEEIYTFLEAGGANAVGSWLQIWAANPSDLSPTGDSRPIPGMIGQLLGIEYEWCGWCAHSDYIFADCPAKGGSYVRLVRLGNIFQAVF